MTEAPKWPDVAERIASRIRSGALAVGDRLPPVADLAREEGVSIKVLGKALDWLESAGVVDRRRNVGIFAAAVPPPVLPPPPDRGGEVARLRAEVDDLRRRVERLEERE